MSTPGEGSVISYNGFWTGLPALGATVLTAWGGYGKNSEVGLSLKRVGPLPAVKVTIWICMLYHLQPLIASVAVTQRLACR